MHVRQRGIINALYHSNGYDDTYVVTYYKLHNKHDVIELGFITTLFKYKSSESRKNNYLCFPTVDRSIEVIKISKRVIEVCAYDSGHRPHTVQTHSLLNALKE